MTLIRLGEKLSIRDVTNKEERIYECHISNRFQSEYSIFTLTVIGMYMKSYYSKYRLLHFWVTFEVSSLYWINLNNRLSNCAMWSPEVL